MKITKIEKIDGIYHVTQTPNMFEKIFGIKERTERYKTNGEVFKYFPQIKIFYSFDGELISWDNKISELLNNFDRKF